VIYGPELISEIAVTKCMRWGEFRSDLYLSDCRVFVDRSDCAARTSTGKRLPCSDIILLPPSKVLAVANSWLMLSIVRDWSPHAKLLCSH
jgi:hypothetical protein